MKKKQMKFLEYDANSWTDIMNVFAKMNSWVFRGQEDSEWRLETTLERATKGKNFYKIPDYEKEVIELFKRRSIFYLEKVPDNDEILEWLSLMQHYGAPTRILDFTKSYYVALFFAVNGEEIKETSVFCLNQNLLFEMGEETEKNRGNICDSEKFGTREYCNAKLKNSIDSPLVMIVEPYNLHERIAKQQGVFAVPCEVRQSFEYNLSLTEDKFRKSIGEYHKVNNTNFCVDEVLIFKLNINPNCILKIRQELKLMNISSETLFPGIEGFSKSLNEIIRLK